jgi:hypothetical protein
LLDVEFGDYRGYYEEAIVIGCWRLTRKNCHIIPVSDYKLNLPSRRLPKWKRRDGRRAVRDEKNNKELGRGGTGVIT